MKTELSKINEEIKSVLSSINEFSETEVNQRFDTREKHIVASIKVYEWLDEDHVKQVIKNNNLQAYEADILEEFNENRLNNIHAHVCECEVSYLKEKYENNVDIADFKSIFSVYNYSKRFETLEDAKKENPKNKYYLEKYFNTAKRFKTFKNFQNFIKKKNESEYLEFCKRENINFDCWQFGRSGGWFSICKVSELESDFLGDYVGCYAWQLLNEDNNKDFNEKLNEHCFEHKETKAQFLSRIKNVLKEIQSKFDSVEQIIQDVQDGTKSFSNSLLNQLEHEINEFVNEDLTSQKTNASIVLDGEIIKTSLGVSVQADEFKTNLIEVLKELNQNKEIERLPINRKVENYFVEYAQKIENDYLIKAGCHKFSLNNILQTFNISI